jgi:MFS family permease
MPAVSTCLAPSCRTKVEGTVNPCPNCGGKMRTPRTIRALGWLLLACGVFLVGLMSYLWTVLAPAMAHPGDLTGGTTFTGTAEQGRTILTVFGAVIVFGLASIGYGLWMIVTGRRSIAMMIVVLVLAAALIAISWRAMTVLPG